MGVPDTPESPLNMTLNFIRHSIYNQSQCPSSGKLVACRSYESPIYNYEPTYDNLNYIRYTWNNDSRAPRVTLSLFHDGIPFFTKNGKQNNHYVLTIKVSIYYNG